jgi:hypothetical protein
MLYDELHERTNYECTYEEYQAIEKIYNDCKSMTKQEAAKIWKQTYGKEHAREKEIKKLFEDQLIQERDYDFCDRSEAVKYAIWGAEERLRDWMTKNFRDETGIDWTKKRTGTTPNGCYGIYELGFLHNGEFESVRYNFY